MYQLVDTPRVYLYSAILARVLDVLRLIKTLCLSPASKRTNHTVTHSWLLSNIEVLCKLTAVTDSYNPVLIANLQVSHRAIIQINSGTLRASFNQACD